MMCHAFIVRPFTLLFISCVLISARQYEISKNSIGRPSGASLRTVYGRSSVRQYDSSSKHTIGRHSGSSSPEIGQSSVRQHDNSSKKRMAKHSGTSSPAASGRGPGPGSMRAGAATAQNSPNSHPQHKVSPKSRSSTPVSQISELRPRSVSRNSSEVALLLVGVVAVTGANSILSQFEMHMRALQKLISQLNPDVFSVTDSLGEKVFPHRDRKFTVGEALPQLLGTHLKGLGLVDKGDNTTQNATRAQVLHLKSQINYTDFWAIDGTAQDFRRVFGQNTSSNTSSGFGLNSSSTEAASWLENILTAPGLKQWFKLSVAWKLMVDFETRRGMKYVQVVKLRFDCTPLGPVMLPLRASDEILYSASDRMFWGSRKVMEVAAGNTWFAIWRYFARERPDPLTRHLAVRAALGTLLSVSGQNTKSNWVFVNKAGTLPYLEMHGNHQATGNKGKRARNLPDGFPTGSLTPHGTMVEHMKAAMRSGLEYVDPLSVYHKSQNFTVKKGTMANDDDYVNGVFKSEKDFLSWMIMNNITACTFGAGVQSFLYKGTHHGLRTSPCVRFKSAQASARRRPILSKYAAYASPPAIAINTTVPFNVAAKTGAPVEQDDDSTTSTAPALT